MVPLSEQVYTFSVTRYSKYFPSISLVCASIPGRAVKINVATGIKTNSNGVQNYRNCRTQSYCKPVNRPKKMVFQNFKNPNRALPKRNFRVHYPVFDKIGIIGNSPRPALFLLIKINQRLKVG